MDSQGQRLLETSAFVNLMRFINQTVLTLDWACRVKVLVSFVLSEHLVCFYQGW